MILFINNREIVFNALDPFTIASGGLLDNDGKLNNDGTLNNDDTLINSGTLNNNLGGTLTNNSGTLDNFDTLTNVGTLTNDGFLANDLGGTLTNNIGGTLLNDGTLRNRRGRLTNYGTLTNDLGGTLTNDLRGTLDNFGTLTNVGTLNNSNDGTLNNFGTLDNFGTLRNNGIINGNVNVKADGILTGSGTINGSVLLGGVIDPANSTGTITTSNQTWINGASYGWEVNDSDGTAGGLAGWDLVDITANGNDSGSLDLSHLITGGFGIDIISLENTFALGAAEGFDDPNGEYEFVILTAIGGIKDFEAEDFVLNDAGFSNSGSWDWSIAQDGNNLVLSATGYTLVPEPTSSALLALGGLAVMMRRKRG